MRLMVVAFEDKLVMLGEEGRKTGYKGTVVHKIQVHKIIISEVYPPKMRTISFARPAKWM